jgi:hypothetical protein
MYNQVRNHEFVDLGCFLQAKQIASDCCMPWAKRSLLVKLTGPARSGPLVRVAAALLIRAEEVRWPVSNLPHRLTMRVFLFGQPRPPLIERCTARVLQLHDTNPIEA